MSKPIKGLITYYYIISWVIQGIFVTSYGVIEPILKIRKYGLPAAWSNEDKEDRHALVVIEVSSSSKTPLNNPPIAQYILPAQTKSSILYIFNQSILINGND